jgi:hypothetical protein
MNNTVEYWRRRCELAESIIAISGVVGCAGYADWQAAIEGYQRKPVSDMTPDEVKGIFLMALGQIYGHNNAYVIDNITISQILIRDDVFGVIAELDNDRIGFTLENETGYKEFMLTIRGDKMRLDQFKLYKYLVDLGYDIYCYDSDDSGIREAVLVPEVKHDNGDVGNWIAKDQEYLLKFKVVKSATEEDMKKFESDVLRSVVTGVEFLPGVELNTLYRYDMNTELIIESAKKQVYDAIVNAAIEAFKAVNISKVNLSTIGPDVNMLRS